VRVFVSGVSDADKIGNTSSVSLEKTPPRIFRGEEIGRGGFGKVYSVTDRAGNKTGWCMKTFRGSLTREQHQAIAREASLSQTVKHPAVLPCYQHPDFSPDLLFMKEMESSLKKEIEELERDHVFLALLVAKWFHQLAGALAVAHAAGIMHRDIKPGNILLDDEQIFLSDWGLAKVLSPDGNTIGVGTEGFRAPELMSSPTYGCEADIFSLGRTLAIVLSHTQKNERLAHLASAMTHADPARRPPAQALVYILEDIVGVLEKEEKRAVAINNVKADIKALEHRCDTLRSQYAEAQTLLDAARARQHRLYMNAATISDPAGARLAAMAGLALDD